MCSSGRSGQSLNVLLYLRMTQCVSLIFFNNHLLQCARQLNLLQSLVFSAVAVAFCRLVRVFFLRPDLRRAWIYVLVISALGAKGRARSVRVIFLHSACWSLCPIACVTGVIGLFSSCPPMTLDVCSFQRWRIVLWWYFVCAIRRLRQAFATGCKWFFLQFSWRFSLFLLSCLIFTIVHASPSQLTLYLESRSRRRSVYEFER